MPFCTHNSLWNTLRLKMPNLQLATESVSCNRGDQVNATVKKKNGKKCRTEAKRSYVTDLLNHDPFCDILHSAVRRFHFSGCGLTVL